MDPRTYRHMDALTQSIECIVCCISWVARWLEDETDCQYLYCCDIFHTGKCEAQWEVGSWIRHSHCNLWALLLPCRWYWQTFHSQRNNKTRMYYCCQRLIFSIFRFLKTFKFTNAIKLDHDHGLLFLELLAQLKILQSTIVMGLLTGCRRNIFSSGEGRSQPVRGQHQLSADLSLREQPENYLNKIFRLFLPHINCWFFCSRLKFLWQKAFWCKK